MDCVILDDITLIKRKLGVSTADLMRLMILDPLINEMRILNQGLQEHGVQGSYLLYCRAMGIIDRSPFSATAGMENVEYTLYS